jgi:hypothetical protein
VIICQLKVIAQHCRGSQRCDLKRNQWANRFERPDVSGDDKMQHKHFVNVLEDVYQIRKLVLTASKFDKGHTPGVSDSDENSSLVEQMALSNVLAFLAFDESTDLVGARNEDKISPKLTGNLSGFQQPTLSYKLDDED